MVQQALCSRECCPLSNLDIRLVPESPMLEKLRLLLLLFVLIIQTFAYCVISLYCEWKNVTRDGFWFNTFLITVSIKEFLLLLML